MNVTEIINNIHFRDRTTVKCYSKNIIEFANLYSFVKTTYELYNDLTVVELADQLSINVIGIIVKILSDHEVIIQTSGHINIQLNSNAFDIGEIYTVSGIKTMQKVTPESNLYCITRGIPRIKIIGKKTSDNIYTFDAMLI